MLADELRQRQTSADRTNAGTSLESRARTNKNKTSAVWERPNLLWNNRPEPVVPSYPGSSLSPIKVRERDGIDLSLSQCSPLTFLYPNSTLQLTPLPLRFQLAVWRFTKKMIHLNHPIFAAEKIIYWNDFTSAKWNKCRPCKNGDDLLKEPGWRNDSFSSKH